jgi:hypothetical protein
MELKRIAGFEEYSNRHVGIHSTKYQKPNQYLAKRLEIVFPKEAFRKDSTDVV